MDRAIMSTLDRSLKHLFDDVSQNSSGRISRRQVKTTFRAFGKYMSTSEVECAPQHVRVDAIVLSKFP